jgi:Plasmid replication region DNA-binding N-term
VPRPPIASRESVALAIAHLISQGKSATCESIREHLGGGSQSTIAKLRKEILLTIELPESEEVQAGGSLHDRLNAIGRVLGDEHRAVMKIRSELHRLAEISNSVQAISRLLKEIQGKAMAARTAQSKLENDLSNQLSALEKKIKK